MLERERQYQVHFVHSTIQLELLKGNEAQTETEHFESFKWYAPKNTENGPHMANIHQEQPSIRNMQMVSSNRVHSTHTCEANKCRIFKPFFLFIR